MNEQYKNLFKNLHDTETGKLLIGYVEFLCDEICDVRNYPDLNPDERRVFAGILKEKIIEKITLVNEERSKDLNMYK